MAETIALTAERRTKSGTGAARQLRQRGRIPAVIYGHGRDTLPLSLVEMEVDRALAGHSAGSTIIDLAIDGDNAVQALIREIQRHPFKLRILHIDFLEIHAGEAITLEIPIRLVGSAEGVKNEGGVLDQGLREIEVEVLPKDIPDHIEVNVEALHIGDSLHVRDISVPNATILTDPGTTICSVVPPRIEPEPAAEVPVEAEEVEPELIRKAREEGESEEEGEAAEE